MKKKFSLWLNIATICLCVCAIAIGVYAVQSATLKVSGSIGFKAHDLAVGAVVKMYGHSRSESGESVKSTAPESIWTKTKIEDKDEIKLNTFYFTDMSSTDGNAEDIVIEFTYTNSSPFEVLATVTTDVSKICDNSTITINVENAYMAKGSETSPTTGEMKVTLSLPKGATDFTTSAKVDMSITLAKTTAKKDSAGDVIKVNKYTPEQQETIWNNTVGKNKSTYGNDATMEENPCYATAFPYYITMGKSGTNDIKWIIVGYNNTEGTLEVLEDTDKSALSAGVLLSSKTYVALSAETLTEESQPFLSSSNYLWCYDEIETIGHEAVNTKEAYKSLNLAANTYYASDIREYLIGETFKNSFSLNDTSIIIKERAIRDISYNKESDSFWLLSQTEIDTLFAKNIMKVDNYYYASASITTKLGSAENVDNTTTPVNWWLRSPANYNDYCAYVVDVKGWVTNDGGQVVSSYAVRPAFQF